MSCEELRTRLIHARDYRQTLIESALWAPYESFVCLSTAIPGINKYPHGIERLFRWAMTRAQEKIRVCEWQTPVINDDLGWFAIFASSDSSQCVKKACVEIEESVPAARLLDLDVYQANGEQLGRQELGLTARSCLVCENRAATCIILKRHTSNQLKDHAEYLLRTL